MMITVELLREQIKDEPFSGDVKLTDCECRMPCLEFDAPGNTYEADLLSRRYRSHVAETSRKHVAESVGY